MPLKHCIWLIFNLIHTYFWAVGQFSAWILVKMWHKLKLKSSLEKPTDKCQRTNIIQKLFHVMKINFVYLFYFFQLTDGQGIRRFVENSTVFFKPSQIVINTWKIILQQKVQSKTTHEKNPNLPSTLSDIVALYNHDVCRILLEALHDYSENSSCICISSERLSGCSE